MGTQTSPWLLWIIMSAFVMLWLTSCKQLLPSRVAGSSAKTSQRQNAGVGSSSHAECSSLGGLYRKAKRQFDLVLRSDNGDENLPKYWRQWWYERFRFPKGPVTLTLKGRGHWNYYLPVFSYDNKTWYQFKPQQVSQPQRHQLQIKTKFRRRQVWLARFVPYSYSRLLRYLENLPAEIFALTVLGPSPQGRPTPMLSVRAAAGSCAKGHVVIHARTHPGEVGASFLLEGLLTELQATNLAAEKLRRNLCFTVVPMVNIDGVIAGNNRTNLESVNLEGKWFMADDDPNQLVEPTPAEIRLLHQAFMHAQSDGGNVTVALNLHASNGRPEDQLFFFPHFGPRRLGYSREENELYRKQKKLIHNYARAAGRGSYTPMTIDGGREFVAKDMPESYWWRATGSQVNALSVEATYGLRPGGKGWKAPQDIMHEGRMLAYALGLYHGVLTSRDVSRVLGNRGQESTWPYRLPGGLGRKPGFWANGLQIRLQR